MGLLLQPRLGQSGLQRGLQPCVPVALSEAQGKEPETPAVHGQSAVRRIRPHSPQSEDIGPSECKGMISSESRMREIHTSGCVSSQGWSVQWGTDRPMTQCAGTVSPDTGCLFVFAGRLPNTAFLRADRSTPESAIGTPCRAEASLIVSRKIRRPSYLRRAHTVQLPPQKRWWRTAAPFVPWAGGFDNTTPRCPSRERTPSLALVEIALVAEPYRSLRPPSPRGFLVETSLRLLQ